MNRKDTVRGHYEPRLDTFKEGHLVQDWESEQCQLRRFQVLLDRVDLSGKRLLDAGCGIGDFLSYCVDRGLDVEYTGVDMLERMICEAQRRHPGGVFVCADLVESSPFEAASFDVVFCSGIFNLRVDDACGSARRILSALIPLAAEAVVFNMLSSSSPAKEPAYCYFDPDEVVQWPEIAELSADVVRGYLQNDFTVICRPV